MRYNFDGFNRPENENLILNIFAELYFAERLRFLAEIPEMHNIESSAHFAENLIFHMGATPEQRMDDRYNLIGFNVTSLPMRLIQSSAHFSEHIAGIFGGSLYLDTHHAYRESVSANVTMVMGLPTEFHSSEKIEVSVRMIVGLSGRADFREIMQPDIHIGMYIHDTLYANEGIQTDIHIGKHIHEKRVSYVESRQMHIHVGQYLHIELHAQEIINGRFNLGLRRYQTIHLDVIVPPGSEIRLDSENFLAILLRPPSQFENIRHLRQGDWIHFDRNVVDLIINNGGNLEMIGDVIYNDRWL